MFCLKYTLKYMFGFFVFNLIPTLSNSFCRRDFCTSPLVASSIIKTKSAVLATAITYTTINANHSKISISH